MADADNAVPSSKKRAAGRELSRDNPGLDDEEEASEQEGTFKRASEEILASRRIVKVRRSQTTLAPSSNPFAGIRLVPPTVSPAPPAEAATEQQGISEEIVTEDQSEKNDTDKDTEKVTEEANVENDGSKVTEKEKDGNDDHSESKTDEPVAESAAEENVNDKNNDIASEATQPEVYDQLIVDGDKTCNEDKNDGNENKDSSADATPLSSFRQLSSSQNAFMGFAGTGFSTSSFSFSSVTKEGSATGAISGSLFGLKNDQPSFPPLGFGLSNNGSSSLFGASGASAVTKSEVSAVPTMQEVPIETGEENEKAVFTADSVLFEYFDGGWKERGKGELKVNVSTTGTGKARLIMRARGNYRLILNASIYPDMKLANMEKKGITFACMNSAGEGKDGLSTFALKFKDGSVVEEFRVVVAAHKDRTTSTGLKTPENSPKASDD